jgi:hypothetical protein
MSRAADFSLLESDNAKDFRLECEASINLPLASPVSEIFRQAHDHGLTIAVVEMPMRGEHRRLFYDTPWWSQYIAHIRNLLASFNVIYIDASDWIQDDALFDDPLHLSARGAAQLSQRLGSLLGPLSPDLSAHSIETPAPKRSYP